MVERFIDDAAEREADFAVENALHGITKTRELEKSMPTELSISFVNACNAAEKLCNESRAFLRAPDAAEIRVRLTAVSAIYAAFLHGPHKDDAAFLIKSFDAAIDNLKFWLELAKTRTAARDEVEAVAA